MLFPVVVDDGGGQVTDSAGVRRRTAVPREALGVVVVSSVIDVLACWGEANAARHCAAVCSRRANLIDVRTRTGSARRAACRWFAGNDANTDAVITSASRSDR